MTAAPATPATKAWKQPEANEASHRSAVLNGSQMIDFYLAALANRYAGQPTRDSSHLPQACNAKAGQYLSDT